MRIIFHGHLFKVIARLLVVVQDAVREAPLFDLGLVHDIFINTGTFLLPGGFRIDKDDDGTVFLSEGSDLIDLGIFFCFFLGEFSITEDDK